MTSENRWLFDLNDILNIRFTCQKCSAAQSYPANKWTRLPYACSNCGEQWMSNLSLEETALQKLSKALESLLEMSTERLRIQVEFSSPIHVLERNKDG